MMLHDTQCQNSVKLQERCVYVLQYAGSVQFSSVYVQQYAGDIFDNLILIQNLTSAKCQIQSGGVAKPTVRTKMTGNKNDVLMSFFGGGRARTICRKLVTFKNLTLCTVLCIVVGWKSCFRTQVVLCWEEVLLPSEVPPLPSDFSLPGGDLEVFFCCPYFWGSQDAGGCWLPAPDRPWPGPYHCFGRVPPVTGSNGWVLFFFFLRMETTGEVQS